MRTDGWTERESFGTGDGDKAGECSNAEGEISEGKAGAGEFYFYTRTGESARSGLEKQKGARVKVNERERRNKPVWGGEPRMRGRDVNRELGR